MVTPRYSSTSEFKRIQVQLPISTYVRTYLLCQWEIYSIYHGNYEFPTNVFTIGELRGMKYVTILTVVKITVREVNIIFWP
jgi:hypothetical protein